jgi:trk system potassium uptake protein TrkA
MGKFAVIGLGFFGENLARALTELGNEVLAIDHNMERVEEIKDHVAYAVRMDSTDERAMRAQGLENMDAVVVSIGEDFESSIYTSVLLQQIGVKRIITRTSNPVHSRIMRLLGLKETIFPEQEVAQIVAKELSLKGVMEYVPLGGEYTIAQINTPGELAGKTVIEANLRGKHSINLVTIKKVRTERDEKTGFEKRVETVMGVPNPDTVLEETDVLVVMGKEKDVKKLLT